MTSTSPASWPVGVALRPPVDLEAATVELADQVTGRRFQCRPEALAATILSGRVPAPLDQLGDRTALVPGLRHWLRRGWRPSDGAYLASRRWSYADTADPGNRIREQTVAGYLAAGGQPPAEQLPDGPVTVLGPPAPPGEQPVTQLLNRRRTGRVYRSEPVPLADFSGLLWYGFARVRYRRERSDPGMPLSLLDSVGSAWDIALAVYGVDGVEPGIYRYDILRHELRLVQAGDHRAAMVDVLQGMHSPETAGWTLGLVADFPRYQWRYRHEHGLRRLWMEAGMIGQELLLLASSYGISTLVTPAQKDRPFLRLHGFDDRRYAAVYTLTQGLSRGRAGVGINGHDIEQVPR
ncbi:SagB/ThcOx family dehydrogenase [Actinoplanes sp. NEAU-A12]|uniref:SagB/ThcOx family dehydrogenase n=1 Tax=Actinoplanes sandaracinus TaxID=3045177 RepID=A0ABT6WYT3_9ACTN|nr:SagB/ThcOx family dehydrogenase [Actinoplanes sandaracinus]MDI6104839.1 SagB/ThcOx family dehydrogenase [Actinoplanes sandaracinus]